MRSFLRACPHEQVESPDNVEQEDLAVIHLLTAAERHKCTHSQSKQNIEVEVGGRFSTNSGSPRKVIVLQPARGARQVVASGYVNDAVSGRALKRGSSEL